MNVIRALGFGELRMHLQHLLAAGTTQGTLMLRINGSINVDDFIRCVDAIRNEHQILKVVIQKLVDKYYFVEPESVAENARYFRRGGSADEWEHVMHSESLELLDSGRQLWRFSLYEYVNEPAPTYDLVLVMHHAIMDAVGSEFLLDQILSKLGRCEPAVFPESCVVPVPVSMESDAISACDWNRFVAVQGGVKQALGKIALQPHLADVPVTERITHTLPFSVQEAQVRMLDDFCEYHEVSLNSLLSVLFVQAVYQSTDKRNTFALFSALSLRPLCPNVPASGLGCYLSVVPTIHQRGHDVDLVEEARQHKVKMNQAFVDVGRWVPERFETSVVESMMQDALASTQFSNDIGFTFAETGLKDEYGSLKLVHQNVTARRSLGNVALILHGLRKEHTMTFTLSYVEPIQSRDYALKVKTAFTGLIASLLDEGRLSPCSMQPEVA